MSLGSNHNSNGSQTWLCRIKTQLLHHGNMMESLCPDVISYILEFLDDSDHALLKHVSKSLPVRKDTRLKLANFVSTIPLLQWARINGCPWKPAICSSIARKGHLEVLQWARANG